MCVCVCVCVCCHLRAGTEFQPKCGKREITYYGYTVTIRTTPALRVTIGNDERQPLYYSELLHLYTPSSSLRFSSDTCVLKLQRSNHKIHVFRTFSHFGPHIWNSLPKTDIRHTVLLSLPSKANSFLFSEYKFS